MEQVIYEGKIADFTWGWKIAVEEKAFLKSIDEEGHYLFDNSAYRYWTNIIYYSDQHNVTLVSEPYIRRFREGGFLETIFSPSPTHELCLKVTAYGKQEDISEVERIILGHVYADHEEKDK